MSQLPNPVAARTINWENPQSSCVDGVLYDDGSIQLCISTDAMSAGQEGLDEVLREGLQVKNGRLYNTFRLRAETVSALQLLLDELRSTSSFVASDET
jgi:hypothetical protein